MQAARPTRYARFGEATTLVVGQTQTTPTQLLPKNPIVFDQVCEGVALVMAQPASQPHQHHLQRRDVDHVSVLTAWLGEIMSAHSWNTTGSRTRS